MCSNCYHAQGRTVKAWVCSHTDKLNYAKGKCQACYLAEYHQVEYSISTRKRNQRNKRLNISLLKNLISLLIIMHLQLRLIQDYLIVVCLLIVSPHIHFYYFHQEVSPFQCR